MADPDILTRPPMTEKQLQAAVVELAGWCGYLVYHPWLSIRSAGGFPDLTLVRRIDHGPPRLIFVELKSERGLVSARQKQWAAALLAAGAEVYTWKPVHWLDGTIERILSGPGSRYGTMLEPGVE
jgi:hypothetical protein